MNDDQKLIATVVLILVLVAIYVLYGSYLKTVFLDAPGSSSSSTSPTTEHNNTESALGGYTINNGVAGANRVLGSTVGKIPTTSQYPFLSNAWFKAAFSKL